MKRNIFIISTLLLFVSAASAQTLLIDSVVTYSHLEVAGGQMNIEYALNLSDLHVRRDNVVVITPCLINGNDSLHFYSYAVYGRRRYYHYLRNTDGQMLFGADEMSYKQKDAPEYVSFAASLPYQSWMNGATLQVHCDVYGCCDQLLAHQTDALRHYEAYVPDFVFVTPEAEIKTRSLEGSAYVDFVVNKTDIRPDYHNNEAELGKIRATINVVRQDSDTTIDNIWLKGYASPESPYKHNEELAIGRVNAIKGYVKNLFDFPDDKITTDYEPENWEGLRRYVVQSSLEHKDDILALIDTDMDPDAKEAQIKKTYPKDYASLLENCYPYLRRTDYRVNYTVRAYSDVEEIKEILRTQPQKLSLNEMYLVAQTYEPGSEPFNEVFLTAVLLYPDDEVANLNAANIEMKRGNLDKAAAHLAKAGSSPEAEHARDIYAKLRELE